MIVMVLVGFSEQGSKLKSPPRIPSSAETKVTILCADLSDSSSALIHMFNGLCHVPITCLLDPNSAFSVGYYRKNGEFSTCRGVVA